MQLVRVVVATLLLASASALSTPHCIFTQLKPVQTNRHQPYSKTSLHATNKPTETFLSSLGSILQPKTTNADRSSSSSSSINASLSLQVVESFIDAYNSGDVSRAVSYLTDTCILDDVAFYQPCQGLDSIERRLRLQRAATPRETIVIDDHSVSDTQVGILFHKERKSVVVPNSRGMAYFTLNASNMIDNVFWIQESALKSGESSLRLLTLVSKLLEKNESRQAPQSASFTQQSMTSLTAPERYFAA
jgi:hypothetical protein